jgi:thiol-disulfide isomerase/thioredoxin
MKPIAVTALAVFLGSALAADEASFDRNAVAARMQERLAGSDAKTKAFRELRKRQAAGEDVREEMAAIRPWPTFDDLDVPAMRILAQDPADQAAFHAIRVLMRTRGVPVDLEAMEVHWDAPEAAFHEYLARLLAKHHHSREGLPWALSSLEIAGEARLALWRKLLESSTDGQIRGNAVAALMEDAFERLEAPGSSQAQREAMRVRALEYVRLIREQYADVQAAPVVSGARRVSLLTLAEGRERTLAYSVGAVPPDMEAPLLRGGSDRLSRYRGRVVLLDFWFVACAPCKKAQPDLVAFRRAMAGKPFEIIGVSVDDDAEALIDYIDNERVLPWPQWIIGSKSGLPREWGVHRYPTYVLLDADGVVRARSIHFDQAMRAEIREWADKAGQGREAAAIQFVPAVGVRG